MARRSNTKLDREIAEAWAAHHAANTGSPESADLWAKWSALVEQRARGREVKAPGQEV